MVTRVPGFVTSAAQGVTKRWIGVTSFILLVILCWLLARWTWAFFPKPKPEGAPAAHAASTVDTQVANRIIGAHLFGVPSVEAAKAAAAVAPSTLNAKLKGVFAGVAPFPAFAILNYQGKDVPIKVGTELAPGVMLESVFARHILLRRAGSVEKLEFEDKGGGAPTVGMAPPARPVPQQGQGQGQPPLPSPASQFKLNVQPLSQNASAFSRAELNAALQDPRQLSNMGRVGRAATGGVAVENAPAGSLMEKLGLQQGDVVKALNGIPVNSEADLMRLYQHFGQAGSVRVDGDRGGQPLQLNYTIQK
jgi:general secretion pathway protein C